MLKKRLIGVVTIKDSWAVQSFGYKNYLPLGRPEYLVENLERWGVDEIFVICIDRSKHNLGPDFSILKRISSMGLSTPLIYGGGICTSKDAASVIQLGAERICVDAVIHDNHEQIREMAELIGAQALIASLPVALKNNRIHHYDYRSKKSVPFTENKSSLLSQGIISEALVIDWKNEGKKNSFNLNLIKYFPTKNVPLIVFGGLSESELIARAFDYPSVVGAGVGNFLNYSEHALQILKNGLLRCAIRPNTFCESEKRH